MRAASRHPYLITVVPRSIEIEGWAGIPNYRHSPISLSSIKIYLENGIVAADGTVLVAIRRVTFYFSNVLTNIPPTDASVLTPTVIVILNCEVSSSCCGCLLPHQLRVTSAFGHWRGFDRNKFVNYLPLGVPLNIHAVCGTYPLLNTLIYCLIYAGLQSVLNLNLLLV